MSSNAMSLKARIKNYARENKIAAQVVLQNYMFERFLARLSRSEYKDKFVIKGGMLIAAIVGLDTRSTMDLDTTLKNLPLTKDEILKAVDTIRRIDLGDDVSFEIISIEPIRDDDPYGGYCVRIDAFYDTIKMALSVDISTGDVITPSAILYEFNGIFEEDLKIELWGYNIETVLAEKVETILRRGVFNTRPRDYYDVYILSTTQQYDRLLFEEALAATADHRGSTNSIMDRAGIMERISKSEDLQGMWEKYRKRFAYAEGISYEDIIRALRDLLNKDKH